MKPKFTLIIYTPQELSQVSYVHTGLFELEKSGFIKIIVKIDYKKHLGRYIIEEEGDLKIEKRAYPKASYYKLIDNSSGVEKNFSFDLYDFENQFPEYALNYCDFVFKRNYNSLYVDKLPDNLSKNIYSLGLTFKVRSSHCHHQILFYLGLMLSNINIALKPDRRFFIRLKNNVKLQNQHWEEVKNSLNIDNYLNFDTHFKPTVFFQTRCFAHEDHLDVKSIHLQRYYIIKMLQKEFPKNFQGGFIPSFIANQMYGDALSNVPSKPELYLKALKQAQIVIYTRGLANSPAWKMAEYLSLGKVIIAERLTTDLPVPLIHGKELLYFESDTELIDAINLVLNNEVLASSLSQNARAYFEEHVHPTQNIKRILEFMISKKDN